MEKLKKILYFLHITDDDDRLNLTDLTFISIVVKIMFSATLDWTAVMSLATICVNRMHNKHLAAAADKEESSQ